MTVKIENHPIVKEKIKNNEQVLIELGCGPRTVKSNVIGVDFLELEGVDILHNLEQPLHFLEDNSVDQLSSSHLLEHVDNLEMLLQEIHRVLKPSGKHIAVVPHFSNPYYYSDYTHKRFFGLYTFDYMATDETKLKRGVPSFYTDLRFDIESRYLNFKSAFVIRNLYKQVLRRIVNISGYTQEFYEEIYSNRLPCSEIKFVMSPRK